MLEMQTAQCWFSRGGPWLCHIAVVASQSWKKERCHSKTKPSSGGLTWHSCHLLPTVMLLMTWWLPVVAPNSWRFHNLATSLRWRTCVERRPKRKYEHLRFSWVLAWFCDFEQAPFAIHLLPQCVEPCDASTISGFSLTRNECAIIKNSCRTGSTSKSDQ